MNKARNGFIKYLRYLCLIGVIALGLIMIVGSTGGGGGGGDGDDGETPSNTYPTATITSPSDGSTYNQGDTISFSGTGEDTEDGTLSETCLVWTSSIDGQIGTGTSFTRDDLSAGTHTITLTATDSDGATGSDSVTITVNALPIAEDVLEDISEQHEHNVVMDITSLPIPDDLVQLGEIDPNLKQAIESMEQINSFVKHPADPESLSMEIRSASASDVIVEQSGVNTWTYTWQEGDLTITMIHVDMPEFYFVYYEYDGIKDGVVYDHYTIQMHMYAKDCKSTYCTLFHTPNLCADDPSWQYLFQVEDEGTVYTPWGKEEQITYIYTVINWYCDINKGSSRMSSMHIHISNSNSLVMETYSWSFKYQRLYLWHEATWDRRNWTGEWTTYSEDGEVTGHGEW